jgi:predicted DsbA family dithiol-disulfide isomerase
MKHELEIFSDYIWPWCYFITGRIERLQKEYDIRIRWTAFPLHPEIPEQGRSLEELFAGRGVDIPAVIEKLKKTAESLGLPFGDRHTTFNSRRAQELGKLAEARGQGEAFHRIAFQTYFVQGRNLAKTEVLLDMAAAAGLDLASARKALTENTYRDAVDADWQRSYDIGITAVPTFRIQAQVLVGAQPYQALENLMQAASVLRRSS